MTRPPEQHAQYGESAIRMHPDNAPGDEGTALVLARRDRAAHVAPTRQAHTPATRTEERVQACPQRSTPPARPEDEDDDAVYDQRVPSSSRRYAPLVPQGQPHVRVQHHPVPARRRVSQDFPFQPPRSTRRDKPVSRRIMGHWMQTLGIGMLITFFGWVLLSHLTAWWTTTQNDWTYGRPRTSQTDAVVGHHDSALDPSHFTVENFDRHAVVIEFQGGDPSKAVSYVGPTLIGPGQDLAPVTVSFRDVTHDGKPDMLLSIEGSTLVFVNTGKTFRPAAPADHVSL